MGFELGEPEYPDGKPLYCLHELAARPEETVWLVEGEWCADSLAKVGVLATTSGAADSAAKADWRSLAGRDVTVWPDNDEAGQRYATDAAESLLALGCTVRVIDVAKLGLPKKGDVVDWLKANPAATAAAIAALPCVEARRGDEWPEPMPLLAKVTAVDYPLDALPDIIRGAVKEVAGFVKAPVPLVASSALGALSATVQAHVDVKRAEKLQGPSSLFLLTIADSGERKTTCDGFFTSAIREFEKTEAEKAGPALKDYAASFGKWTAERDGILLAIKQAKKTGKATGGLGEDLKQLEHDKPEAPRVPKLLCMDETPEHLAWLLAKEWPSAVVASSEAGIVFGAHAMGRDSIMRNLALLNILWDGRELSIGRRTSESFTVRSARLTLALQVQEVTLRNFFERSEGLARGTGFLARFLIAWPESTQGYRPFTEAPENWPALAAFNQRIAEILEESPPMNEEGDLSPAVLMLTPDAKAEWVKFHDAIEGKLRNGGELCDVRDVASKTADNAVRLAALFQAFEDDMDGPIGPDVFKAASRIAAWHLNESRRFFGEVALSVELANTVRLDTWLIEYCRREGTSSVPTGRIQQYGPAGLRERAVIDSAVRELDELDRARLVKEGRQKKIEVKPGFAGWGCRMTLADLIHGELKNEPVGAANAKAAKVAKVAPGLAGLATLALASPGSEKTEGAPPLSPAARDGGPDRLWWRVAILEPGGRTVEVDTPSGWNLPEWQAFAERYHGPGSAVTAIAGLPRPTGAPVPLDEALAAACEGVAGISPEVFRSLLSPEDIADIEAGEIPAVPTLRGYAQSFAEGIRGGMR
ncbi:MAG: DUF3987 domain-containing protein [Pseudomonadota bacterium]|nr:DUF3987 domain-containing protein [Pseudomonadota bacterium]